jgi:hypothetical protein
MTDTNSIPFEYGEFVKSLVGKTLVNTVNGKETQVIRWEGSDLIISDGTKYATCPAMGIVNYVQRDLLKIK